MMTQCLTDDGDWYIHACRLLQQLFLQYDALIYLLQDILVVEVGVGYRWEFKKNVNVRLDYGFGKSGQSGFLFNINEAF